MKRSSSGISGKHCDKCADGYWKFSDMGCQFCGCDAYGSKENGMCDAETGNNMLNRSCLTVLILSGQCECREHVTGQMCELCEGGYYNITSRNGCQPCNCGMGAENNTYVIHSPSLHILLLAGVISSLVHANVAMVSLVSSATNANLITTVCRAKVAKSANVVQRQVRRFLNVFLHTTHIAGQVCDEIDGRCVCPKNTEGEMCEKCIVNTWNHDPYRGCEECECNKQGSIDLACNVVAGQCSCKEVFCLSIYSHTNVSRRATLVARVPSVISVTTSFLHAIDANASLRARKQAVAETKCVNAKPVDSVRARLIAHFIVKCQ